jgi:hypothetical protein
MFTLRGLSFASKDVVYTALLGYAAEMYGTVSLAAKYSEGRIAEHDDVMIEIIKTQKRNNFVIL